MIITQVMGNYKTEVRKKAFLRYRNVKACTSLLTQTYIIFCTIISGLLKWIHDLQNLVFNLPSIK